MYENKSDIVRNDILLLKGLLAEAGEDNAEWDLFKVEQSLNSVLDHVEFLQNNLPIENMPDDVEDEVVECERYMNEARRLVEQCKVAYHIENVFYRDQVTSEFHGQSDSIIDTSRWQKEPRYSTTATFICCLVMALIIGLIYYIIMKLK